MPTLEQIRHVIRTMPATTEIERRDRALVAFTILTGARDGAIASLKLKHVDVDQGRVDQDARQVKTKFSKSFTTWFFPVGNDIRQIVVDWVDYLRREKLWGLDDPLFPATKIVVGETRHFEASGLDRKHWSSAGPIRAIFKNAFAAAGLPYFNPHSFRKTLALLGGQICKSPEEYKAWSQNLGHENVLTTFSSYGDVALHRQAEIIRSLGNPEQHPGTSRARTSNGDDRLSTAPLIRHPGRPARRQFGRRLPPMHGGEDRHQGVRIAASSMPAYAPKACR